MFSYRDVTDVSAIFVADPFMIRHNELWYMFFGSTTSTPTKGDRGGSQRGRPFLAIPRPGAGRGFQCLLPHVFPWQGQIYMVPEMYSRTVCGSGPIVSLRLAAGGESD